MGVGASFMQCNADGVKGPVYFFSKKLNKCQKGYSTIERRLFLLLAVKHYDVYLGSSPFSIKVFTDHNPLKFVHKMKTENQRLLRWSLPLQEYDLDVHHVKGSDNVIADALSQA